MAFQRQRHIVARHAAAIVGDFDQIEATRGQTHRNLRSPCINGVFDQFLQRTGWSFYHFTGSDAVDERVWKPSY
jgi:hypothetical protein